MVSLTILTVAGGQEIDLNSEALHNDFEEVVVKQEINEDTEVVFSSPQHQKKVGRANTALGKIIRLYFGY